MSELMPHNVTIGHSIPFRNDFRSNIEHRWATFFWLMRMCWRQPGRYEPKEFCKRGYWIDFKLPRYGNYDKAGTFIEIKVAQWQRSSTGWQIIKNEDFEHGLYTLLRLAKYTRWNYNYYLIVGDPGMDNYRGFEVRKPGRRFDGFRWHECNCNHGAVLRDEPYCCTCSDSGGCFVEPDTQQLIAAYKTIMEVLPFGRWIPEELTQEELINEEFLRLGERNEHA